MCVSHKRHKGMTAHREPYDYHPHANSLLIDRTLLSIDELPKSRRPEPAEA